MAKAFPELLAISDRRSLGDISFESWLAELRADGVAALALREKDLDDRSLFELARLARRLLPPPAKIMINGRIDIALAAGCDGVHLPANGVPACRLRQGLARGSILGCSTHSPEEVMAAARAGADYVVYGPVFPTPSKARYGAPVGLAGLQKAVLAARSAEGRSPMPVLALGGVSAERLASVVETGAAGAAGIRLFQQPSERRRALGEMHRLRSLVHG